MHPALCLSMDKEELHRPLWIPLGEAPDPVGELIWVAGGAVDWASISLVIDGDDVDPDILSAQIGSQPTDSGRKGDVRRRGKMDFKATRGFWRLSTERRADAQLEDQIVELFDRLTPDMAFWEQLGANYEVSLFCGLWLKRWNRGTILSARTLSRIAERGLSVDLDIYYEPDEDDDYAITVD